MINVAFVIFLNSPTASSIVPWQIFKLRFIGGDARSTPSQTPVSVTDNGNPGAASAMRHGKIYYVHKSQCAKYSVLASDTLQRYCNVISENCNVFFNLK